MERRRTVIVVVLFLVVGLVVLSRMLVPLDRIVTDPGEVTIGRSVGDLYGFHFRDARAERLFLASLSFFVTFAITRLITHAIHAGRGPFHDVVTGGQHIHHLVWGILALLGVGYLWLMQVGTGNAGGAPWASSATALLFGAGAALTLDEFALWLTLTDVYWEREGRLSIDAIILFGSLLSISLWGGPFIFDLLRLWSRV